MSDSPNGSGAAAQPGSQPAAQPTQANPASQFIQVDPGEYQRLQRAAEQARGAQSFYEKAKAAGFDRAEAFDSWKAKQERLSKSGLSIDALIASMENERGQQQPEFNPDEFAKRIESSVLEKAEARIREADSLREHKAAMENYSKVLDELVGDLVGKGSDEEKAVWKSVLKDRAEELRRKPENLYPEDHPLRQHDYRPIPREKLAPVLEDIKKMRAKLDGARLAAKGQAANATTGTPAGNGAGQGNPETKAADKRHFSQLPRDQRLAQVKEMLDKRGKPGAALSSVGG